MLKIGRTLAVVLILGLVLIVTGCASGLALYINVQKGDSYKYHAVTSTETTVEAMGQKVKSTQDMEMDYGIKVEDVDSNGIMSMKYTYDAMKVTADSNGAKQSYDSKNPDASNPLSKVYGSFIGKGFTSKMTKMGEIKEIKGTDQLYEDVLNSVDVGSDADAKAMKEQLKATLKESFGDDAIMSALQQSTKIFPKDKIKVGGSWETQYSMNTLIKLDMKMKYTLDKVDGDWAYVSVSADYATDSSKSMNLLGLDMKPDLKGTLTGKIKININNGFLTDGSMEEAMTGKMSLDTAATGKMELPMDIKIKVSYNTVKQ